MKTKIIALIGITQAFDMGFDMGILHSISTMIHEPDVYEGDTQGDI